MYARIAGTGSFLPEKILTNADLEALVDTSDEWIRSRTGISVSPRRTLRVPYPACGMRPQPEPDTRRVRSI